MTERTLFEEGDENRGTPTPGRGRLCRGTWKDMEFNVPDKVPLLSPVSRWQTSARNNARDSCREPPLWTGYYQMESPPLPYFCMVRQLLSRNGLERQDWSSHSWFLALAPY